METSCTLYMHAYMHVEKGKNFHNPSWTQYAVTFFFLVETSIRSLRNSAVHGTQVSSPLGIKVYLCPLKYEKADHFRKLKTIVGIFTMSCTCAFFTVWITVAIWKYFNYFYWLCNVYTEIKKIKKLQKVV